MPIITLADQLQRLRDFSPVNEQAYDEPRIKHLTDTVIVPFVKECHGLLVALEGFKNSMKVLVPIKDQELTHYKGFVDYLVKYEEAHLKTQQAGSTPGEQD